METLARPHSLIANFGSLWPALSQFGPPEVMAWREANLQKFVEAGFPTAKSEEFRYLPMRAIVESEFAPAYDASVSVAELASPALEGLDAYTITFVNGKHAPELSNLDGMPKGVTVATIAEIERSNPDLLRQLGKVANLEGRLGTTNDERFVWLNNAHVSEGAVIHLAAGAALEKPIHVRFVSKAKNGPFAAYPRLLILADEGSSGTVVETHTGVGGAYFSNSVTEIVVAKDAVLEHTKFQDESAEAFHIATIAAKQAGGSTFTSNNAEFGGRLSRNDVNVFVEGEHAETWLNGAYVGRGEQIHDSHTRIDHTMPNCHSFEVYKGILADRSTGVFNGKIFVYQDAQKTDAKQTNQALLLSPTATINTKPQLEIFADDVKCTHGATVGQLREDALFYLRARGIPKDEARNLLVYAFVAEVLEKIGVDSIRIGLEKMLFEKLGSAAGGS